MQVVFEAKHSLAIACLALILSACAPTGFKAQCGGELLSPETVTYPDGANRKSDVFPCNDGCTEFRDVNDHTVGFNSCGGGS